MEVPLEGDGERGRVVVGPHDPGLGRGRGERPVGGQGHRVEHDGGIRREGRSRALEVVHRDGDVLELGLGPRHVQRDPVAVRRVRARIAADRWEGGGLGRLAFPGDRPGLLVGGAAVGGPVGVPRRLEDRTGRVGSPIAESLEPTGEGDGERGRVVVGPDDPGLGRRRGERPVGGQGHRVEHDRGVRGEGRSRALEVVHRDGDVLDLGLASRHVQRDPVAVPRVRARIAARAGLHHLDRRSAHRLPVRVGELHCHRVVTRSDVLVRGPCPEAGQRDRLRAVTPGQRQLLCGIALRQDALADGDGGVLSHCHGRGQQGDDRLGAVGRAGGTAESGDGQGGDDE